MCWLFYRRAVSFLLRRKIRNTGARFLRRPAPATRMATPSASEEGVMAAFAAKPTYSTCMGMGLAVLRSLAQANGLGVSQNKHQLALQIVDLAQFGMIQCPGSAPKRQTSAKGTPVTSVDMTTADDALETLLRRDAAAVANKNREFFNSKCKVLCS